MKYWSLVLLILVSGFCYAQRSKVTQASAAAAIAARGQAAAFTPSGPLEIYTYGLADFGGERSRARVARRWGFSYRSIAGCVVTQELLDSADRHNRAVEMAIARQRGADWKARFEAEVSSAMSLDSIISAAARRNATIAEAQRDLDAAGKGMLFEPGELRADGRLEVYAYAYDQWENKPAFVTQYTLAVDTAAARAEIVNDNNWLFRPIE